MKLKKWRTLARNTIQRLLLNMNQDLVIRRNTNTKIIDQVQDQGQNQVQVQVQDQDQDQGQVQGQGQDQNQNQGQNQDQDHIKKVISIEDLDQLLQTIQSKRKKIHKRDQLEILKEINRTDKFLHECFWIYSERMTVLTKRSSKRHKCI